jgi:hypothetical protein
VVTKRFNLTPTGVELIKNIQQPSGLRNDMVFTFCVGGGKSIIFQNTIFSNIIPETGAWSERNLKIWSL